MAQAAVQLDIQFQVERKAHRHRDQLPGNGGHCRAAHAQLRQAAPAVDQKRVQHNIDQRTADLRHR